MKSFFNRLLNLFTRKKTCSFDIETCVTSDYAKGHMFECVDLIPTPGFTDVILSPTTD